MTRRQGAIRSHFLRQEQGILCSPHVLVDEPSPRQVLEGESPRVELRFGAGIDSTAIMDGSAVIDGEEQPFKWYAAAPNGCQIQVPVYSARQGNTIADGDLLELRLKGLLAEDEPLKVANRLQLQVFRPNGDFDGDGLENGIELAIEGLDPARADSDGNGVADGQEDTDGDGLDNASEQAADTRIDDSDTDDDGLSDGEEVALGTDPNLLDSDTDGLSDSVEHLTYGSDPLNRDSDGDLIDDGQEIEHGLDPTNPSDATADPDEDGLDNLAELANGAALDSSDTDGDGLSDGEVTDDGRVERVELLVNGAPVQTSGEKGSEPFLSGLCYLWRKADSRGGMCRCRANRGSFWATYRHTSFRGGTTGR